MAPLTQQPRPARTQVAVMPLHHAPGAALATRPHRDRPLRPLPGRRRGYVVRVTNACRHWMASNQPLHQMSRSSHSAACLLSSMPTGRCRCRSPASTPSRSRDSEPCGTWRSTSRACVHAHTDAGSCHHSCSPLIRIGVTRPLKPDHLGPTHGRHFSTSTSRGTPTTCPANTGFGPPPAGISNFTTRFVITCAVPAAVPPAV